MPWLAVTATIDETSLLVIAAAAALAGLLVMFASPKLVIPVVVVELLLGIVIGPQVADIAQVDPTTKFLGNLGHRGIFGIRDRLALAFYSATELPLVVAITTIAVQEGHMRSSTAAALVGAAIISALVVQLIAMRLRRGAAGVAEEAEPLPGGTASAPA